MISEILQMKLDVAYKALDDAYVQAVNDGYSTANRYKETAKYAKAFDRCINILDKARGWK